MRLQLAKVVKRLILLMIYLFRRPVSSAQTQLVSRLLNKPINQYLTSTSTCVRYFCDAIQHPKQPKVGVSVVILRQNPHKEHSSQVVLVKRSKNPAAGKWAFPGGQIEIGESMTQCAIREAFEETGIRIKCNVKDYHIKCQLGLDFPVPFYAVDVIEQDGHDQLMYHYVVVQLAARPIIPEVKPEPGDDVSQAKWIDISQLSSMQGVVERTYCIALKAAALFKLY
eukprot:TRINITY_DN12826_c0_g1_i2.p1 TRINITY_DN12826_c0_g1~~TRINITY_DN12826_c0_g1_i2.p1  ORF type:complete len:225 (+),score=1.21 TRINITY_DN12826_c0_g1_i2:1-675(+)